MTEQKWTRKEIEAALSKHMHKAGCDVILMQLKRDRVMEQLNENIKKTGELIERNKGETGAQWLRTQEEITKLFAENDALTKEAFGQ